MKNNKILFLSKIVSISFITFVAIAFFGSFSFSFKTIAGTGIYFVLTYLLCKKYPNKKYYVLTIISLPIAVLIFFINILDFKEAWISLPGNILFITGIFTGFLFSKSKNLSFLIALSILVGGWELSLKKMYINKMFYGTINQHTLTPYPSIKLTDSSDIELNTIVSDKIIVLDFWNSGCGPCFGLFPIIDSINKKIDTSKYDIRLVNIPLNGQKREGNFRVLNKFPYALKQLFAQNESVADSFKIVAYPTTLIIKKNKIVFRGEFENAIEEMKKL